MQRNTASKPSPIFNAIAKHISEEAGLKTRPNVTYRPPPRPPSAFAPLHLPHSDRAEQIAPFCTRRLQKKSCAHVFTANTKGQHSERP